jgi:hypothetical protein
MSKDDIAITSLASLELVVHGLAKDYEGEVMWWRGHSKSEWTLKPGAFRPNSTGNQCNGPALINTFKQHAYGRLGHRAIPTSDIEWLYLAQHYGLPTQLLDWTENPLKAIYFALCNSQFEKNDACLWVISPTLLNVEYAYPEAPGTGQSGFIDPDEPAIQAIIKQAVGYKDEHVLEYLINDANKRNLIYGKPTIDIAESPMEVPQLPKVVSLVSPEMDERIISQAGRFTLHSSRAFLI